MSKLLFAISVISIIYFSCGKKQTTPPVIPKGLSMTINGKNEKFNSYDSIYYAPFPSGYIFNIFATDTSETNTRSGFQLELASPLAFKPGAYTNSADSTTTAYFAYDFSTPNLNMYYSSIFHGKSSVKIVITSITGNNIQGTFSGTASPQQGNSGNAVITNGEFNFDYK